MSSQLDFLHLQALQLLQSGNLSGSELLLKQIVKNKPNHSEALRLLGVIAAQQGNNLLALERVEEALLANRRNGVAHSNKGNILLSLDHPIEAIEAYKRAIKLTPNYAEAHSNLGNGFQVIGDYSQAIECYQRALKMEPSNLDFKLNLGNAYSRMNSYEKATQIYEEIINLNPSNPSAHFYLAQIQLFLGKFQAGWMEYEWRWLTIENDSKPLKTSRQAWQGESFEGCLYIWAEQGIGDQILHASMLPELRKFPQKKIISVEKKLLPIFKRSFPDFEFIDKATFLPEHEYDQHIPIANLGKFFRNNKNDFIDAEKNYLVANEQIIYRARDGESLGGKKLCGISWKSTNKSLGKQKSIALMDLSELLKIKNVDFINLQYGDTAAEIRNVNSALDIKINDVQDIDLYEDIDSVLGLIDACDIILTTSNSTAHLAGGLGKEVLLLLPFSVGRFWYWHDIDGVSLWYPSIRVFKQEKQGDWSKPIEAAKKYLESRFAI